MGVSRLQTVHDRAALSSMACQGSDHHAHSNMCTHTPTPAAPHTHLHTYKPGEPSSGDVQGDVACSESPTTVALLPIPVPWQCPRQSLRVHSRAPNSHNRCVHALHILTLIVTGARSLSPLCMPACRCVGSSSSSRTRFSPQFHRSSSSPGRGTFPPVDHPPPPSTHPRALRCCHFLKEKRKKMPVAQCVWLYISHESHR